MDEQRLEREIDSFYREVSSYGYSDIKEAVKTFFVCGFDASELAEAVQEYSKDVGTPLQDIDVCAVAYERILQLARTKINDIIGYDFLNDFKGGGSEIYVYGNYCATSFDYSENAIEELQDKINKANEDERQQLRDDELVSYFLNDIGIEIDEEKIKAQIKEEN